MMNSKQLVLILDNIRSMHNVGAIFRTADGLGVAKIYLCGITAIPPRKEIHKTALGAETRVPWEHIADISELIPKLQHDGFTVAALEITPTAESIITYKPQFPLALIVGHETEGVDSNVLKSVDTHIYIPMTGGINSFNVSSATAMAAWHLLNS